jgi:RNA polymerase sigma-70 factor (ECF subfamily)
MSPLHSRRRVDDPSGASAAESAGEGLEARFETLLTEYGGLLRAALARACSREMLTDLADLEQEARIRVWRALGREGGIRHPASYIQRVAASVAIDALRRARRRPEETMNDPVESDTSAGHDPPDEGPSPDVLAEQRQAAETVQIALRELADNRRRAVGLHLRGFTSEEIGALLEWSEPKARNLVYRGLEELRAALRDKGVDGV